MSEPDPRTDQELLAALNAGDRRAFDALYLRYRDWIVRLAARWTAHDADSLDVLQETFRYLLGKTPHLRLTASMTTFLYPVVKHLALAARRKRERAVSLPADPSTDPSSDPRAAPGNRCGVGCGAVCGENALLRADLQAVLGALPEGQREVILMRFVDDMTLEEIAAALAIPLGTTKSRLHNALATLREDPRTRRYFDR